MKARYENKAAEWVRRVVLAVLLAVLLFAPGRCIYQNRTVAEMNEYVTAFMVSFGVVPANFRQVEAPRVYCSVLPQLTGGTQFVNQADVGGVYGSQWIMATSRWVTRVYKPSEPLPRTGY